MHPPRPHGLPRGEQRLLGMYSLRKISSVEAANLFGKLSRLTEPAEFESEVKDLFPLECPFRTSLAMIACSPVWDAANQG
jgi:hypothetical protein